MTTEIQQPEKVELKYEASLREAALAPDQIHTDSASTHSQHILSGWVLYVVVFSLCLAQFLSALDITIVATALPTISSQLNVSSAEYTWVGSSYNLASTALTPLWAKYSDIWGRKPLLLTANATFMAGSLVAGLSATPGMLIAGRTLQGVGGGGIAIMVSIIIADLFPLRERAKYYGLSSVVWAIASALGPVLGGVFTQTIGWRWCFFINLPLDGISLVLLSVVLRTRTPTTGLRAGLLAFDWVGSATIVGGTVLFLCGLEGGTADSHGWKSAYTLCMLLLGIALITIFVVYEFYLAANPITPMRVFVGRVKVAALVASAFHSFVFISYDYFLPLYFQVVLGTSAIMSGVYLFALIIPLSLLSAGTGMYIKKTGNYHYAAWIGSVVMATGTGLFINLGSTYVLWKIIVYELIAGLGAGALFLSPMIALQNHLQKEDIAAGTSAFTFLRSIATSISIVIGGVILQRGIPGQSLTNINSHDSNNQQVHKSDQQLDQYAKSLSTMWVFYTALCGLIIASSSMITKKAKPKKDSATAARDD